MFNLPGASPRWLIFLLDLIVVNLSWSFSIIYWVSLLNETLSSKELLLTFIPLNIVNISLFFISGLYKGIVRFTGAYELLRIFFVSSVGTTLIYFFDDLSFNDVYSSFSLFWFTYLILAFIGLSIYRFIIKFGFRYFSLFGLIPKNVVIFGAGAPGASVKSAIDRSNEKNFIVRAFIDQRSQYHRKRLDGIVVIAPNQFEELHRKYKIERLIIASLDDNNECKNEVLEFCIAENIEIKKLPQTVVLADFNLPFSQFPRLNIEELLGREPILIEKEQNNVYNGKCILITGAAGSIGSELVRQLLYFKPKKLIICDQAETPLNELILKLNIDKYKDILVPYLASVTDDSRMKLLFDKHAPQIIFHAAAYKHVPLMEAFPGEALKVNVLGTQRMADFAAKYKVDRFIMVSTDKAVNPTNVMGASKRLAEMYIQSLTLMDSCSTRFITTRFGNVLGSNGSVINRFKAQIEGGGPVTVTHPDINRFFMTVSEACQLVIEAGNMGNGGEVFVFDMGKAVKIDDLAKKMIKLAGYVPNKDIKIQYSGLRPGEKLFEELLHSKEKNKETHHEKILVADVRIFPFHEVRNSFLDLKSLLNKEEDEFALVHWMKNMVPEFVSNNSDFEALDDVNEKEKLDIYTHNGLDLK
jgi:FlaA1/EpsC-like NDP-sugar epimerase